MLKFTCVICLFFLCTLTTNAEENFNRITIKGKMTCINSNGVPEHEIGRFPNRANPNEFKKHSLSFCFPTIPRLTKNVKWGLMTVGVSSAGIPIRPYTAEYFDLSKRNRYSKNSGSGWRKQAMYDPRSLGIDLQNGHVDRSGLYHYHGIMSEVKEVNKDTLIGYAPDGFKIIYRPNVINSSWKLKSGKRPSPPGGIYNGEFEEDFEYHFEYGSLDECTGMKVNEVYTYFATETYPFFPRCFKGEINRNFMVRNK